MVVLSPTFTQTIPTDMMLFILCPNRIGTKNFGYSNPESPIYIDLLGVRPVGASDDTPLQYSWDVPDNTTAELELFARVYTVSEPILRNSVEVNRYSNEELFDLGYQPGAPTNEKKAYAFAEFDPNFDLTIEQAAETALRADLGAKKFCMI